MMKDKDFQIVLKILFAVAFCSCSEVGSAQYSVKLEPITKEALQNANQILKPKVKLLSFSHLNAEHCYHPTLGAFCILENKIEKKASFPVKMRLGSVDYVDKLEKKRN